jgi:hypothetical protein
MAPAPLRESEVEVIMTRGQRAALFNRGGIRKVQSFYCRVPTFWGDEALWTPSDESLMSLGEGKISDWPPEWQPFVRLLRSKKPVPKPLPLDLLPSEWRRWAEEKATCRRERDLALAKFIEDRMPEGRKREGVPNSLVIDAKTKFRLKSKSAILRANKRGKQRKLSWEELKELKLHLQRAGFAI